MSHPESELPRWDLTIIAPNLDSQRFVDTLAAAIGAIARLSEIFDQEGVGRAPGDPARQVTSAACERVLNQFNATWESAETMRVYLSCLVAVDSCDDDAQASLSEWQRHEVALAKLATRLTAWIGELDLDDLIGQSALIAAHAYPLRLAQRLADHLMSPGEEALLAELNVSGGVAWAKLHDNLTSQLSVEVTRDGVTRTLPMSEVRNLALVADREVRRSAYEAELAAWAHVALPAAAALNSIKGQVITITRRRGWDDPLDEAIFVNHIDRATLEAMLGAARTALPDFRRYLRAKAIALGLPALAWYDLFAPVGSANRQWTWEEAVTFLTTHFGAYSDRLRNLIERAVAEQWIDAGPRTGKQGGAFCSWLRQGESRILMNYAHSYDGVSTLAHELGHAYHNVNERDLTPLQRQTPATLAETASIFCETIVKEATLLDAGEAEQLFILEQSLQGACQVVVDILSRFEFERRVFAARQEREVAIAELNQFMRDAQLGAYGDGLDPTLLHSYMWVVKGHYYSSGLSFYNFPYMFGLLFGLGLFARYREDSAPFRASYDDLLASTGQADAAELAARYDIDLRSPSFWQSSLDVVRADIDRFVGLVARM